jgi:pRiA4b ORF-3-like protein
MSVYRFKISFEDHEDVYREIEIRSEQTFEDLHYAIQSSIAFDAAEPASFYMSNDHWTKGQEISLHERPSKNGSTPVLMKDALLRDWIVDPHQKIYYESDYSALWTFFVELIRIIPVEDIRKKYPVCVKVNGDAPKQRGLTLPFKADENEEEVLTEPIIDDYVEDESELDSQEEEVIDEDEADAITDEGLNEAGPAEEEV